MEQVIEIISHPLVMPIVAPLLLGALAYAVSRWSAFLSKIFAVAAAAVVLAGGVYILRIGDLSLPTQKLVELSGMISLDLAVASSPLGMIVLLGSAGFAILITIYSFRAMSGSRWEGKFYAYLTWALAGCCIVALADNLLVLLVGWELVTLMLFLMLNLGRADAPAGAAKTYGVLGFADACLLMAVVLLMTGRTGSASLSLSNGAVSVAEMGALGYVVYVLILIAALAKAGAVPLHTWIPAAARGAPASVMAFLPAAADKLLGIYLLAVLSLRMFRPDWTLQVIMMIIGAVTIIAAVLMAMVQHNLKRLLAFHAVSQVGYMVLGIGTGTPAGIIGGLFHMLNNAIYKSNLFLMSGTVRRAVGSDEIEEMGGLARYLPVTFICGLISAMAISGVPPFNGFASKWLVYQGALSLSSRPLGTLLLVTAVFGSALTLASFVKVMHSAFLAPPPSTFALAGSRPRESFFLAAPMVVLAAACVLLGLWPAAAVKMFSPAVAGAAGSISAETATVSRPDRALEPHSGHRADHNRHSDRINLRVDIYLGRQGSRGSAFPCRRSSVGGRCARGGFPHSRHAFLRDYQQAARHRRLAEAGRGRRDGPVPLVCASRSDFRRASEAPAYRPYKLIRRVGRHGHHRHTHLPAARCEDLRPWAWNI